MHPSTFAAVSKFAAAYMDRSQATAILDVGSQDINGTYRPIFETCDKWSYLGLDQAPGKNVDRVVADPYKWPEVGSESFDVVVCGQMFEHCPYFWDVMKEIKRVLKPGGFLCVVVPCAFGHEHRYPLDCYRFLPDGLRSMAEYVEMLVLTADYVHRHHPDIPMDYWMDTMLIAKKPK